MFHHPRFRKFSEFYRNYDFAIFFQKIGFFSGLTLRDQPVELKEDLTYEERPVQIVDRKDQVLRNKVVPLVKVLWMNHGREEATWEREDQMQTQYPHLF